MTVKNVGTIGLIGAGNIGRQVAQLAVSAGYDVVLSNSRGPQSLTEVVAALGSQARPATPEEAASAGDLVVVTVPLKAIGDVPAGPLASKTVIDTTNYYPQRDGHLAVLDRQETTSSQLLQERLPGAHVVKAFNHIYAAQLTTDGRPAGEPGRRALAVAGDDPAAKAQVSELLDELGFDTVDVGRLTQSWRIQPDTPGYGPRLDAAGLSDALASATRPAPAT